MTLNSVCPLLCVITLKMLDFRTNCVKLVEAEPILSALVLAMRDN